LIWIKDADHGVMLYWFSLRGKSGSYDQADCSCLCFDVGVIGAGYAVGTSRA
jgi:hypothetical protein